MPKRPHDSLDETQQESSDRTALEGIALSNKRQNVQIIANTNDLLRLVHQTAASSLNFPTLNPNMELYNPASQAGPLSGYDMTNMIDDHNDNMISHADAPSVPLSNDQKKEILFMIERVLESQSCEELAEILRQRSLHTTSSRGNGMTHASISRSQKNELLLLFNNTLEFLVDESSKIKRRHYSKEQKDEIVSIMNSCKDDGMSANAAIKYINTIPGYEKVSRKMIREWKGNNEALPRGRKVCEEFELEVLREIAITTGRNFLVNSVSELPDLKTISYDDVKIAARNVRDRAYEEVGQKWAANPKTKDLQFSSNWVRKLLRRNIQRLAKEANNSIDADSDSDNDSNAQS